MLAFLPQYHRQNEPQTGSERERERERERESSAAAAADFTQQPAVAAVLTTYTPRLPSWHAAINPYG